MTDVDIDGIMQEEMTWAVKQKRGCKIDDENAFSMRVTIVGPDGQLARVPMQWHSMDDKYKKMEVFVESLRTRSGACRHRHHRYSLSGGR